MPFNTSFGEMAALGTALFWAFSCQIHSAASRHLGATGLALMRLPYGIALMGFFCLLVQTEASFRFEIIWPLALASIAGIVICDPTFYMAVLLIGPRVAVLVQSLSSCLTAVMGYLFLGEQIGLTGSLGIGVAIFGVFVVVSDGGNLQVSPSLAIKRKDMARGVLLAFCSALALAVSFIFLKQSILNGASALWASFVRLTLGGLFLGGFALARGWVPGIWAKFKGSAGSSIKLLALGGLFGTLGIWLSGLAVQHTQTGVAATIIALEPILIIPINAVWEGRRPSLRAVAGAGIAFAGMAILFLR